MFGTVLGAVLALGAANACTSNRVNEPLSQGTPHSTARSAAVSLEQMPIPEGVAIPGFGGGPASQKELAKVRPYMRAFFPAPLTQPAGCNVGGDIIVTFKDGSKYVYGPCARPASIDRLWAAMEFVASHGHCAPRCGPNGEPPPESRSP